MKVILIILLFSGLVLAQVTASRVSGDTLFIKIVGVTTEIPLIAGKKNMDSLFINEARFKDNVRMDSTLILNNMPEYYGAVGDSVTDDYIAFNTALNSGDVVKLKKGAKYRVTQGFSIADKNIHITSDASGDDRPIIYFDGNIDGLTFFANSVGTTTLSDTALVGATKIKLTSVSNIKVGDLIRIISNQPLLGTLKGEIQKVISISNDSVQISDALWDSYYTGTETVTIDIRRPIYVEIKNIIVKYVNPMDKTAINLYSVDNVKLDNVDIYDSRLTGIALNMSYGGLIQNCYIQNISMDGLGYGISVVSSYNTRIDNNHIFYCRRGIDVTNSSNMPISRNILVENNLYDGGGFNQVGNAGDAYGTHSGAEYITFRNNVARGTTQYIFRIRSNETIIEGNNVTGTSGQGTISAYVMSMTGKNLIVRDNVFSSNIDGKEDAWQLPASYQLANFILISSTSSLLNDSTSYLIATNNIIRGFPQYGKFINFPSSKDTMYNLSLSNNHSYSYHNGGIFSYLSPADSFWLINAQITDEQISTSSNVPLSFINPDEIVFDSTSYANYIYRGEKYQHIGLDNYSSSIQNMGQFTGTQQADTTVIPGAEVTDHYQITPLFEDATFPTSNDVLGYVPKTDTLIVRRPAGGTSDLKYIYKRTK